MSGEVLSSLRADFVAGAALWVGRVALAAARCIVGDRKLNPLRALGGSDRSRCGAVHILRSQSEPSAHFGWVGSLSLWRGAHSEITLGGSNRARCGAVHILICALCVSRMLSLWRGAHFEIAKS